MLNDEFWVGPGKRAWNKWLWETEGFKNVHISAGGNWRWWHAIGPGFSDAQRLAHIGLSLPKNIEMYTVFYLWFLLIYSMYVNVGVRIDYSIDMSRLYTPYVWDISKHFN